MAGELAGLTQALAGVVQTQSGGTNEAPVRFGVPENARPAVIASIAERAPAATLVMVPFAARAQALLDELTLYTRVPVHRLPESDRLPYEFARDDGFARSARATALAALREEAPAIVVASWVAFSEHCAGPGRFQEAVDLSPGTRLNPTDLVARLEQAGYDVDAVADRPGTVARHGGVVDAFPAGGERPARIEFFGDEVESIRLVDLSSQRSVGRVEHFSLPPAATGMRAARKAAARLIQQVEANGDEAEAVTEQLQLIADGLRTDYESFFELLLFDSTAADHCSPNLTLISEDDTAGRETLATHLDHQERARTEQEARGAIPTGLPGLNVDGPAVSNYLAGIKRSFTVDRFGDEKFGTHRLPIAVTPGFAGKLKTLVQQCIAWTHQGRAVVIASQQALRIADLIEEDGHTPRLLRSLDVEPESGVVTLVPVATAGGFRLEESPILVTDTEIFGFRKRRRPLSNRKTIASDLLATLEVGSYLVHADHGIGRFAGMVKRVTDGVEREYLELNYAERDRLYVPADQLDSISPYIGPTDRPPSLTRLGSQDWTRTKRRVRQAVLEMAQDLIELYAKREVARGHAFGDDHPWQMEMEAAFPFVETSDQLVAIAEVKADMQNPRPMDRLICGDVGFGKTEVAVRAAFKSVMAGKQVAVLVPTTVLAEQHGQTFRERTAGFPVRVEVLSRFRSEEEQREIVRDVARGEVDIAVGTHRLVQNDVSFKDLGLVIIDEEQRFGVSHKERLKKMREEVDVLTLSATPIPRTLQMSLAGIRDMSTVMTPPEERLPIRTYVTEWDDEIVREAIERELERGGQVYFVHNRVHGIERIVARLRDLVPEARMTVGHGQMPEAQLERVMTEFAAGDHDVLVCTTIIESGLDIPNVNTIIINDANRLGLAQLYQLRGRVGRAANRAYAYLLYDRDRAIGETAQKRLEAVFEATELGAGFQIALRDLEIRGAGNVLGSAQSGHIASVGFEMYSKLVAEAVTAVKQVMRPDESPKEPPLPPSPTLDLPLSAHVPESYIPDMHQRLAVYQRVAQIEDAAGVASMQEELRDRYGPVPPAIEHLLYVALLRSLARRARIESIMTTATTFHIKVRGGVLESQREKVEALRLAGVRVGPEQVRIERIEAGEAWMTLLVRIVRTMMVR